MPLTYDLKITPGADGCRLWIDGLLIREGLTASEAVAALQETRRLAMCGAHDALGMLAAALATRSAA